MTGLPAADVTDLPRTEFRGHTVTRALFIDMGQGREDKRTGLYRWFRPPRARYECRLCTYSDHVEGAAQVAAFVAHIRDTHKAACPATNQGAPAA